MFKNDTGLSKFLKVLLIVIFSILVLSSIGYILYTFVPAVQTAINIAWNWVIELFKNPTITASITSQK